MIWMISGLNDPKWLSNIIANFERQTFVNKRLLIVENGNGISKSYGHCGNLTKNIHIIQSAPGAGQYMTAGLNYLKSIDMVENDDWFCKCDADDYYGPEYLNKYSLVKNVDYSGSKSLFIRNTTNQLWYARSEDDHHVFHGPTIAGNIRKALDFPTVQQWGEDGLWCQLMHEAGMTCQEVPPEYFCYQRWNDNAHTWPCTDIEMRVLWQVDFFDLGKFDEDIVNGKKPMPIGQILEKPEVTADNFMPWRILREQGLSYVGS